MNGRPFLHRKSLWLVLTSSCFPPKSRPILNVVQLYTPEPTKTTGDQTTLEKAGRGRERQRKMNRKPKSPVYKEKDVGGEISNSMERSKCGFLVDWRKGQVYYVSISGILNERETFH